MGRKERIVIAILMLVIILKLINAGIAMKVLFFGVIGYYVWKYIKTK
jgi:hypothetical protein